MSYLSAYHGLEIKLFFRLQLCFLYFLMLIGCWLQSRPWLGWLMQAPVPMDTAKWRT